MAKRHKARLRILAVVALAIASLMAVVPAVADFSSSDWHFYKAITVSPSLTQDGLVEVVPDREVFANASPGLADVRIIEAGSGREVPYKLLVERGEQRRSSVSVSVRDLGHVPGQYTSFVVDLGKEGVLHNELEVLTPTQNFQRVVSVEGSADGAVWAYLQPKGQIFDFTIRERSFTQRYTRVQYPASTVRFLRVRIQNGNDSPLEVTGATTFFVQELPPRETELPVTIASRKEEPQERRTMLTLDLGSQGIPTSRLTIGTSQENFYRQVRLEGSSDGERWSVIQSSETVYAYNTPRFVGSKLTISYPEVTYRHFRLTIYNEDNPPLPVDDLRAFGALRKLIFSASPGSTYQLYYGNSQARTPSYELERIFPYLVTENLPQAQLGSHVTNPSFVTPVPPPKPFTERYPWLLPTVLAAAGLLIGLFLANLLRQVRKLLPPPAPPTR